MPPSGYSIEQVRALRDFLSSCFAALEAEADMVGRSIRDALQAECADIERGTIDHSGSPTATAVLQLTKAFYERLANQLSCGASPTDAVETVLDAFEQDVLAIHIVSGR